MATDSDDPALAALRAQLQELYLRFDQLHTDSRERTALLHAELVDDLSNRIAALRAELADAAGAARRHERRRDAINIFLALLGFIVVIGVLQLLGRSIELRYELERQRLKLETPTATAPKTSSSPSSDPGTGSKPTTPSAAAPANADAASTTPTTPREIIERYIERQAQPAHGGSLGVSVSVNGVVDLVKSLGAAGVIGAKTVSDLTAELTKKGADVAAHTAKALVDKYLGPAPPADKDAGKLIPGAAGQQVLVNVYAAERHVVPSTPRQPPATHPPVKPPKRPPACVPAPQCVPTAAIAAVPPS